MGCAMFLLRCVARFTPKTRGQLALSSGEAELYAIGYGVVGIIVLRNCLREVSRAPKVTINCITDSAAGNLWQQGMVCQNGQDI